MRILNIGGMSLIALAGLCFIYYFIKDICWSLKQKKTSTYEFFADDYHIDDDDENEDEPYVPKLSGDALQKLKSGREFSFVEQEIYPAVPRILAFMTMQERHWVDVVLSAFIGIIVDEAPSNEQDFATVLYLLENAFIPENADETWQTPTDLFIQACQDTSSSKAYNSFRKLCTNQQTVLLLCTQIIQTICVNQYGYVPTSVSDRPGMIPMKGVDEA